MPKQFISTARPATQHRDLKIRLYEHYLTFSDLQLP